MPHGFTTLRHPLEKLLKAEHFLARKIASDGLRFQFELNAFLSASRNVTFILHKALSDVPGFAVWYDQQRARMKSDTAMRFFLELRNISQKHPLPELRTHSLSRTSHRGSEKPPEFSQLNG